MPPTAPTPARTPATTRTPAPTPLNAQTGHQDESPQRPAVSTNGLLFKNLIPSDGTQDAKTSRCLDESPLGAAVRRNAPDATDDQLANDAMFLVATVIAASDCMTPEEYGPNEHQQATCVIRTAGGIAEMVDVLSKARGGDYRHLETITNQCQTKAGRPTPTPGPTVPQHPPQLKKAAQELARHDHALWTRVGDMTFLNEPDIRDAAPIWALAFISRRDPQAARRLAGTDITEEDRAAVALAYHDHRFGHPPNRVNGLTTTERDIETPVTGEVALTVASEQDTRHERTLDVAETAIRWLERYLDEPLPRTDVLIRMGGRLPAGGKGANTQVSIVVTGGDDFLRHEITHYWWHSQEPWLQEGIAHTLVEIMRGGQQLPKTIAAPAHKCPGSRISDVEHETGDGIASACAYSVGEHFMAELHNAAGPVAFRTGLQRLVEVGLTEDWTDSLPGTRLDMSHVRDAFRHTPDALQQAEEAHY